jgi:hypothetical protein
MQGPEFGSIVSVWEPIWSPVKCAIVVEACEHEEILLKTFQCRIRINKFLGEVVRDRRRCIHGILFIWLRAPVQRERGGIAISI